MYTKTYEGMTLRPIYTRQDWPSARIRRAFRRYAVHPRRPRGRQPGRQLGRAAGLCLPDPAKCNDIILNELARGVTSLHLADRAARAGLDADQPGADALAGVDGVMIYSVDDLDRLLTGVYLDLVTVSLDAGAQAVAAAAMLEALWHRRRLGPDAAKGAFNADPLGALAATGTLPVAIDAALAQMADLARHAAATYPHVTAVGVDTSPITTPAQPRARTSPPRWRPRSPT